LGLCAELSGSLVDFDVWNKGQGQRQFLDEISSVVADRLESVGFMARTGRDLSLVGLQSRQSMQLESFRDLRIIPTVARRKRRSLLKDVECWLDRQPFARMWTFTTGTRCNMFELRERLSWLHRKVSRLNAKSFMKKNGVSIVFRSTEFGEIEKAGDGALPTFHPHAHCLVKLAGKLSKARWAEILNNVHEYWNHNWDESGRLKKSASEVVKYVAKPLDLLKLSGAELKYIQEEVVAKSRMVECLGCLRSERKYRDEQRLRVDKINGRWRTSRRWNAGGRTSKEVDLANLDENSLGSLRVSGRDSCAPTGAQVLARCLPSPIFSPVREPVFLVEGLGKRDPVEVCEGQEAREVLDFIRVHTTSVTVTGENGHERKKPPDKVLMEVASGA
tara:strand:- start:76 stop:1242 length:1167 start_codon:yes stop_codon:yes gene_type:complete